jgi:hypothetical protein
MYHISALHEGAIPYVYSVGMEESPDAESRFGPAEEVTDLGNRAGRCHRVGTILMDRVGGKFRLVLVASSELRYEERKALIADLHAMCDEDGIDISGLGDAVWTFAADAQSRDGRW